MPDFQTHARSFAKAEGLSQLASQGSGIGFTILQTIIESLPHIVFWKDERRVYRGCNAAFVRSLGLPSAEAVVGRTDAELPWAREFRAEIANADAAVLSGRRRYVDEPREDAVFGTPRPVLTSLLPLFQADGSIGGIIGVVTDISELRRTQEALAQTERRWELALKSSGAGVWEIDMQTGDVYRSPRICAMLGYGPDEVDATVTGLNDLVHPQDLATAVAVRDRVESGETDHIEMEYRLRCKDGSYRSILSRGAVLGRDASGMPTRLVGTFTDITDQYADRDRAAQARKLESIGSLAAGVAHEINTPLQFVSDSVEFLRGGFDDILRATAGQGDLAVEALRHEIPRALDLVQEGIMRIAEIVRAMREFSHPDSRTKEAASVADLLRTALAVARHEYRQVADIRTEFAELPPFACHAGELSQVFVNLLVNAAHAIIEASPDGSRRGLITVRTRQEGAAIVVEIEDTGCGIPAGIVDRIFDPFFTTKPIGRGTGQGLSLARNVVEQRHAGRITVDSQVGRGTLMRIVLPFDAAEAQVAA
jgi:two-component system, NtrC family, sensor kinase